MEWFGAIKNRRVLLGLGVVMAPFLSCTHNGGAEGCEDREDCLLNELCIAGECTPAEGAACGTGQPCPEGQYCCHATCGEKRCCVVHTDCRDGHCQDGRCRDGPFPECPEIVCQNSVCDLDRGLCVECTRNSDCTEPKVCGRNRTCIDPKQECSPSGCPQNEPFCAPQEGCRTCREDTSDCGNWVCVPGGGCVACDVAHPCNGGLVCGSEGQCVIPLGTRCGADEDCGPYDCRQVSGEDHNACMKCLEPGHCPTHQSCDVASGTCGANPVTCDHDGECSPPATVCESGTCRAGCTRGGCFEGQACSVETGRCYLTGGGEKTFGANCVSHGECLSGACWAGQVNHQDAKICTWPCVKTGDCPTGSVCWELGDSNFCVWIDLAFTTPLPDLDRPPGAACAGEMMSLVCRSGYCHRLTQTAETAACMQMCGRDADCANLSVADMVCVSNWPVGEDKNDSGVLEQAEIVGFTQVCHLGWGHLGPNLACGSGPGGSPLPRDHDACRSGWCVETPDRTRDAHCAQPCCTPADCGPNQPICKPIDVWDGIREANEETPYGFQKVCLWKEFLGTREVGEECSSDSQCKSEICVAANSGTRRCTHTCCTNDDCAGYGWATVCRKPYGEGSLIDSHYSSILRSLGRKIDLGAATGEAIGVSGICLPP